MVARGKRRSSQSGRGTKRGNGKQGGPPGNSTSSPVTPVSKKRRVVNSSPSINPTSDSPVPLRDESNSAVKKSGIQDKPAESRPASRERPLPKVLTPPLSRRRTQSMDGSRVGILKGMGTARQREPRPRTRTAEMIPEESGSDDRDVVIFQREPLEDSEFYKRYVSENRNEANIPQPVVQRVFSPVSTGNATSEGGGRPEDDNVIERPGVIGSGTEEATDHQNRDANDAERTNSLSVTRQMLSSFCHEIERNFVTEIQSLRTFISEKFQQIDSLESSMADQLNDIRIVASSGRKTSCSQSRPTRLAQYEGKLDALTPHGDWVFNVETMSRLLRVNLCMFIVGLTNETGDVLENISLALRAVLFGLLPSQRRAAFTTGVGRKHSHFRLSVVLNIIYNVQQNVFNRFLPSNQSGDCEGEAVANDRNAEHNEFRVVALDSTVMQIKQPKWLQAGFIRRRHVEEARSRLETNTVRLERNIQEPVATGTQRKHWLSVKDSPDEGDIARYGALKIYRYVTTGLYQAREKARCVLFEELTYLLTIWGTDAVDIDQRTLRLQWAEEVVEIPDNVLSSVPRCVNRKESTSEADEQNQFSLSQFLSAHREMVLYVTHDVKVRMVGSTFRKRYGHDKRELRRAINLVDVASKFCVAFTEQAVGDFSHLPFLGAHQDSLKCIYAVALMLRGLVDMFMDQFFVNGEFSVVPGGDVPRLEYHDMALEYLLPAASVRKRLLLSRCLGMGLEDFNKINVSQSNEMGSTPHGGSCDIDEDHIDCRDHGVVLL